MYSGNEDFDQKALDYFAKLSKRKRSQDMSVDELLARKLEREVDKAERVLSSAYEYKVEIDNF